MEEIFDFKPAKLIKSKAGKGWYIVFYVWDVQKNDLVRKRKYIPAKYTTDSSKEAYAKDLIKKINQLLKEGYHIDRTRKNQAAIEAEEEGNKNLLITDLIPRYVNYCKNIAKNTTKEIHVKINTIKHFCDWLEEKNYPVYFLSDIKPYMCLQYFDELIEVKGISGKTYNNKLGRLKNFFNVAKKRKWVDGENPFNDVERQNVDYGEKNLPYSEAQIKEIIPYIKEKDPYLYKFICFIYYGLMRTTEIRKLKVENIDLEKRLIKIYSDQSKVRKFDVLPIADGLYKELLEMNIEKYPPEYYLFSIKREPSDKMLGYGWATQRFRKIKEHFKLHKNHSIYSFKHTAVCRWYEKEKDIVRIQRMCRHASIEMTARYLKSLGLLTDEYRIDTLPDL
jgi:integrase